MRSLRERRAAAQLLADGRGRGLEAAVRHLLAVQAQDARAARLALRARVPGLDAAALDRALGEERALVVGWLGRGTLHLVHRDDYRWLLALTAPERTAANARRLAQEGVTPADADRGLRVVEDALVDEGPLTRAELGERLAVAGVRVEGQALPHLLMLAALRGIALLGPERDGTRAFALVRDWLADAADEGDPNIALAELARRYLAAHGPATAADLAAWIGLPLGAARAGLHAIAGELAEESGGLVDLKARRASRGRLAPRLLPAFDPYMLGWRDRSFAVPPEHARRMHPGGGTLRAVAVADGTVIATWSARRRGSAVAVELDPFAALDPGMADALRAEAAAVERFLSDR